MSFYDSFPSIVLTRTNRNDRAIAVFAMKLFFTHKAALALQIGAILLMQLYSLVPVLTSSLTRPTSVHACRGNHLECGCSPARIASRTCCCYHRQPSCCDRNIPAGERQATQQKSKSSAPCLYSLPCGNGPDFIPKALAELIMIIPERRQLNLPPFSSPIPGLWEKPYLCFNEPPTPPPKFIFLS